MDEDQKEKFRKQLESYKKDLGLDKRNTNKSVPDADKVVEKKPLKFNKSIDFENELASLKEKTSEIINNAENKIVDKIDSVKESIKENQQILEEKAVETKAKLKPETKVISISAKEPVKEPVKEVLVEESIPKNIPEVIEPKEPTKVKIDVPVKEIPKVVKETVVSNNEIVEEKKNIVEKTIVSEAPKKEILVEKAVITEEVKKEYDPEVAEDEEKRSFLPFIIAPLLLILIGSLVYYFYSESKNNTDEVSAALIEKEKAVQDSILAYENAQIENYEESESLEVEEVIAIPMSDTIFNVSSENPEGYYVVVGAYGELKNAKKLQNSNPTIFESYIFDGKMKRVGLLLGDDDTEIMDNLEALRFKYPDAWIMYNTNE